tara:strand:+ start:12995 stop:14299 length:1305 start_codon:yes stop_codon:yes gene_type:complete
MYKNAKLLWQRAQKMIPGGNGLLSKRPERFLPNGWPTYFTKSKGVFIWDLNNKKYIDMSIMGIGTSVLGYNNSYINTFVKKKIDLGINTTLNCIEEFMLAKELLKVDKFADQVKFARGGGEAMSLAVRIARSKTRKSKVLFCGYHGWHDWYLAANLKNINHLNNHLLKKLKPLGVPKELKNSAIPFNSDDINKLVKLTSKNDIAAIVIEPSRFSYLEKKFVKKLNQLCIKKRIILIVDEITSGWRECLGGVYKKVGLKPNIVVYGKALGNGYAISALVGSKKIMDIAQDTFISSTAWTERVGFAAALAVINYHKKYNVFKHNIEIGKTIRDGLIKSSKKHNIKLSVNKINTVINFNFLYNKREEYLNTLFTELMLKKKFLATNLIYVSYFHKKEIVKKYLNEVDDVFSTISKSLKNKKNILKSKIRTYKYKRNK